MAKEQEEETSLLKDIAILTAALVGIFMLFKKFFEWLDNQ